MIYNSFSIPHMYIQRKVLFSLLEPRPFLCVTKRKGFTHCLQVWITSNFWHLESFSVKPVICVMPAKQLFAVHKVCRAICELRSLYINFPDAAGQNNYKVQFCEYGHFSEEIGCINGRIVSTRCPSTLMLNTRTVTTGFLLLFSVYPLLI